MNRNRNVVVVATAVAIVLISVVSFDVLLHEDDSGGDESRPEVAAKKVSDHEATLSPRSELAPDAGAQLGTGWQQALRPTVTDDSAPSSAPSGPVATPRPRGGSDLVPPKGPLVSRPLPTTASRRGGVVGGYPRAVLRVLPGAQVRSSSVASSRTTEQVSLTATTTRSAEEVAAFYRLSLARFGFLETVTRSAGDTTGWGFRRGRDSVVVTTTPRPVGCSFMLLGVLHAD